MSVSKNAILALLLLLGVAGFIVLVRSPFLGHAAANAWLGAQPGGGADTGTYIAMQSAFTASYQWLGTLLLAAGLLALVRRS